MTELTVLEKVFIENHKLIKNGRYFHCINEIKGVTLEGKTIYDRDKWKCKIEDKQIPPRSIDYIHDLDGFFPGGIGVDMSDLVLTKDWVSFTVEQSEYGEFESYYCGVTSGNFTNGKEIFYTGKGKAYHMKRYLSCNALKYWMEEDDR